MYYEAPTDRNVVAPLTLAAPATVVDVFPTDCPFMMQDSAGHIFTYTERARSSKASHSRQERGLRIR